MIQTIINKLKPKREYVDFTNSAWKSNPLIGLHIVTRAYRKLTVALFLVLFTISLITPDLGVSGVAGFKLLQRYG